MAERTWGLNSLARCGLVSLDLDESTDDAPVAYALTLVLPNVELRFEIAGPVAVRAFATFMRENLGRKVSAGFHLGVLGALPLRIIKDDEHADRFFITTASTSLVYVTIVDPIATDLVRATEELVADLSE